MESLNTSYIKGFVTKATKETGANINIFSLSKDKVEIDYNKNSIFFRIVILPGITNKYEVHILNNIFNIITVTNNLNEIIQGIDLILIDYMKYKTTRKLKAVIKAKHWGVRLVTVERQDRYRANLYVSHLLWQFIQVGIVQIQDLDVKILSQSPLKIGCKYTKNVLDYDKIQKEKSWDRYTNGFESVKQYPNGNDYMHPSTAWQKGKIF